MIRVTHILEATEGGTARHLLDVGVGLAAAGFSVEALVSLGRGEDFPAHRLEAAGVSVVAVPMAREIVPGADLRALWRIYRRLRRFRPQIAHTHSSKAGILGRTAAAWAGVPAILHTPHAFAFQMRAGAGRRALYLALELAASRKTSLLVAVSRAEGDLAVASSLLPAQRVVVIENGIRAEEAGGPAEGAVLRRELGISAQAPLIAFAGRLADQKAPQVLVRAAAPVLRAHPATVFALAGEGPLRALLESEIGSAQIQRSVRLLGHRKDIRRLYAAAQVFALPSRWEGLPYALLEAMNAGLPVAGSDIPAVREVVRHGESGLLAPPDDPEALARAILCLLDEPALALSLGAAGKRRVRAHYTLERQIERLAGLYRSLAAKANETKPPGGRLTREA